MSYSFQNVKGSIDPGTKPGMFFKSVDLINFMKSFISFGIASPRITDASDFVIRKVS